VLALTSNPEGAQVQHRGHPSVAAEVLSEVARRNATTKPDPQGPHASASVGVVVGANLGPTLERLGLSESLRRSGGPILAPGVGAQGATPADLASAFAGSERRVLAPVSRGLVASGLDVSTVRERCRLLNAELRESLYR
jgi:orotidine-5'-phosphate decarboxylase